MIADVSIDAVGSETTCADAVLSLRRRGRHVQIGLLPSESGLSAVPMARAIAWELDLLGSHGMPAADYPGMLALIRDGRLRPQDLIERTVGLAEAAQLLPRMPDARPAGLTMIDPRRCSTIVGRNAWQMANSPVKSPAADRPITSGVCSSNAPTWPSRASALLTSTSSRPWSARTWSLSALIESTSVISTWAACTSCPCSRSPSANCWLRCSERDAETTVAPASCAGRTGCS